jgi:hypothetical protein
VNKVIGDHEMKFGFEGRQHQMNYIQTNAPNGIFSFRSLRHIAVSERFCRPAAETAWLPS